MVFLRSSTVLTSLTLFRSIYVAAAVGGANNYQQPLVHQELGEQHGKRVAIIGNYTPP